MRCPQCDTPISHKEIMEQASKRAKELWKQKFSAREAQRTLDYEGFTISRATVGRLFQSWRSHAK